MEPKATKRILKVILIGEANVGKTQIVKKYVKQEFTAKYAATLGADFLSKDLVIDGQTVTLQIWDTAGKERFKSNDFTFYRGATCCVLVYDITDKKTFEKLESHRDQFKNEARLKNPDTFPFFVQGNKSDKEIERQVDQGTAKNWASQFKEGQHFETSALKDSNLNDLFQAIAKAALAQQIYEEINFPPEPEPEVQAIDPSGEANQNPE